LRLNDGRGKQPPPVKTGHRSIRQNEVDESAERHTSGTFGEPGLGVVVPSSAGDVQVNPGRVACEFLDEHGASDGAAALAAADVLDIGDGPLDEIAVIVVNRHLPHFFASGFRAGQELIRKGDRKSTRLNSSHVSITYAVSCLK